MSDSEFSGFEEDGNYDEGLSEIFTDISIISKLNISLLEEYDIIIINLRICLLICKTPIQLESFTQPMGVTHNLDFRKNLEIIFFSKEYYLTIIHSILTENIFLSVKKIYINLLKNVFKFIQYFFKLFISSS